MVRSALQPPCLKQAGAAQQTRSFTFSCRVVATHAGRRTYHCLTYRVYECATAQGSTCIMHDQPGPRLWSGQLALLAQEVSRLTYRPDHIKLPLLPSTCSPKPCNVSCEGAMLLSSSTSSCCDIAGPGQL